MKIKTIVLVGSLGVGLLSASGSTPVSLQNATATFSQTYYGDYSVGTSINGTTWDYLGWAIYDGDASGGVTEPQTAVFETTTDVGYSGGSRLEFTFQFDNWNPYHFIGRFRLSVTTDDRSTFADGLATGGDVTANWTVLDVGSMTSLAGTPLSELADGSVLASGPLLDWWDYYKIEADTTLTGITGVRLEVLADASLPTDGPGRQPDNGNFILSEFGLNITPISPVPEPAAPVGVFSALLAFGWLKRRRV
ncbi:MAG: PEP-CTERM sorting domain-containing protein [Verrucomicrobia bacterium]|nr:PEP-CTERM sorting domain-containing protein [Verrucomicrobiota bacterium]